MSEDTQGEVKLAAPLTMSEKTEQPKSRLSLPLLIALSVSLLCNVVLLVMFVQDKNTAVSHVDMEEAFGEVTDEFDYDTGEYFDESVYYDGTHTNDNALNTLTSDPADYSMLYKNLVEQSGVEWFQRPVIMPDLRLYEYAPQGVVDPTYLPSTYLQLGTYEGQPIVFILVPCDGMCYSHLVFILQSDGTAKFIEKNSVVDLGTDWSVIRFTDLVTVDKDFELSALTLPDALSISSGSLNLTQSGWLAGIELYSESELNSNFNPDAKRVTEFIEDTKFGPLFRTYYDDGEPMIDYSYGVRLAGGLLVRYDEAPLGFMTDDRVPQITWTDGGVNTDPYRGDRLTGCGGGGPEILTTPLAEPSIELVGKTKTGELVYNLLDPNHPLITRVFEMTNGTVYEYNQVTGDSTTRTITPAEFIANRGVLLIESQGRQLVFTNTKYGPQAECGKPVIYLYPEATTTISVSVDALVTKSEPVYKNGWVATAAPSGALVVEGETYTSLFWDGYGNGVYPEITEGFIVPTEKALATMAEHLRVMGFTEFEISEFVTFWSDHMPSEPYTRITWFETREMERLAKLTIDPRPDTLFRAFVDYEGINEPFDLPLQTLTPNVRKGYVVTEWGGLLRK